MAGADCDLKSSHLFEKDKCLNDCEAKLTVGEEESELYVCMEYMGKLSDYFRAMFFGDFKEKYRKEFQINDETTEDMICFFKAIDPDSRIQHITDDSIGLLMRLADKYQCDILKEKLKDYIGGHCGDQKSSTILNWLIWSLQYHMPAEIVKLCLPAVACLALSKLVANQDKIGLDLFNKLIDAKFKVILNAFIDLNAYISDSDASILWCGIHDKSRSLCKCPYKCRSCFDHPTTNANKQQCFCARSKYASIFNRQSLRKN